MPEQYEMKLEDFEQITDDWLFKPELRRSIEARFAEIGIIAQEEPLGVDDDVYLDITIPAHIFIAAPETEDETED